MQKQEEFCIYNAPIIVFKFGEKERDNWRMVQGNCHHWDCPRCGQVRAKQEYWRIVKGAEKLSEEGHNLYFFTITCRGSNLKKSDAEKNYLLWTDRLNAAIRMRSKAKGGFWCYSACTERQKRGMPHSHYITTYLPDDAKSIVDPTNGYEKYTSEWLKTRLISSGLGRIYDYTKIDNVSAVSRYVAKYLFKDSSLTEWPKGWRRVRYSQNWPKNDDFGDSVEAFAIVKKDDWKRINEIKGVITTLDPVLFEMAKARGYACLLKTETGI